MNMLNSIHKHHLNAEIGVVTVLAYLRCWNS